MTPDVAPTARATVLLPRSYSSAPALRTVSSVIAGTQVNMPPQPAHARAQRIRNLRAVARARIALRRNHLRLVRHSHWTIDASNTNQRWMALTALFIGSLVCCAFCGFTAMGGTRMAGNFQTHQPVGPFPPAALQQMHLINHMRTVAGLWQGCPHCSANPEHRHERVAHLQAHGGLYIRAVLNLNPATMQLLSLVDVKVHIQRSFISFWEGSVERTSLLEGPLIAPNAPLPIPGEVQWGQATTQPRGIQQHSLHGHGRALDNSIM